jgi:hypothetical protein
MLQQHALPGMQLKVCKRNTLDNAAPGAIVGDGCAAAIDVGQRMPDEIGAAQAASGARAALAAASSGLTKVGRR